jgi:phosphatidylserine/phosphatidylglycerophosphate/cardiolipin synthase-like enzyme
MRIDDQMAADIALRARAYIATSPKLVLDLLADREEANRRVARVLDLLADREEANGRIKALEAQASQGGIEVYFSPNGGCTNAIVKAIQDAKKSILIQAYTFTSLPIAKALVSAKSPGMRIEAILDKSQRTEKYSSADFLFNAGIPVKIDAQHAIAHNKVIIVDGETTITGSFNFTRGAEEDNAENLLVIRDKVLAGKYTKNWENHARHSEIYRGRQKGTYRSIGSERSDVAG